MDKLGMLTACVYAIASQNDTLFNARQMLSRRIRSSVRNLGDQSSSQVASAKTKPLYPWQTASIVTPKNVSFPLDPRYQNRIPPGRILRRSTRVGMGQASKMLHGSSSSVSLGYCIEQPLDSLWRLAKREKCKLAYCDDAMILLLEWIMDLKIIRRG